VKTKVISALVFQETYVSHHAEIEFLARLLLYDRNMKVDALVS
jgi:hypothetical protein